LTRAAARVFADGRRAASVRHDIRSLIAQRAYGLCCGWEDVADHNTLRREPSVSLSTLRRSLRVPVVAGKLKQPAFPDR